MEGLRNRESQGKRGSHQMSGSPGGLNWSAQHLREVYSQESESPKFFADVDLDAARS